MTIEQNAEGKWLYCLNDLAGPDASGAHVFSHRAFVFQNFDPFNVWPPDFFGLFIGMADVASYLN
jgi:hypothetical protein